MKKTLTLSNEQAMTLYSLMFNKTLEAIQSRKRWRFLEVLEENVLRIEDGRNSIVLELDEVKTPEEKNKKQVEINKRIEEYMNEKSDYTFEDREIFASGKAIFEACGKAETLAGRQSKMYKQIEDAFMDVKESE